MKYLRILYLKKVLKWYFIGICFLFYASLLRAEDYTREGLYLRWTSGVHYGGLREGVPSSVNGDGEPRSEIYFLPNIYAYATEKAILRQSAL